MAGTKLLPCTGEQPTKGSIKEQKIKQPRQIGGRVEI
jgi:hypothetical protein